MKTFDINRFWNYLKLTVYSSRKEVFSMWLSMIGAYMVIFLASQMFNRGITAELAPVVKLQVLPILGVAVFIMSVILGTSVFNCLRTTQERISFLMVPASTLEKFIARCVYVFILMLIGTVGSFIVADLLRMFISLFASPEMSSSMLPLVCEAINVPINRIAAVLLGILWLSSGFTLGGIFFRRHQAVLTIAVMLAVNSIVTILVSLFATHVFVNLDWHNFNLTISDTTISIASYVFLIAMIVLNYWLSYFIFKRVQAVNNKLINV